MEEQIIEDKPKKNFKVLKIIIILLYKIITLVLNKSNVFLILLIWYFYKSPFRSLYKSDVF